MRGIDRAGREHDGRGAEPFPVIQHHTPDRSRGVRPVGCSGRENQLPHACVAAQPSSRGFRGVRGPRVAALAAGLDRQPAGLQRDAEGVREFLGQRGCGYFRRCHYRFGAGEPVVVAPGIESGPGFNDLSGRRGPCRAVDRTRAAWPPATP